MCLSPLTSFVYVARQQKRAKTERKEYVSYNIVMGSRQVMDLIKDAETGLSEFIRAHSRTLPLWDPEPKWGASPSFAHLQGLRIPRIPLRERPMPDLLLYALGEAEKLDPEMERRIHQLMHEGDNWSVALCSLNGTNTL